MTKAFVDTTILTDVLLKSGEKAQKAKDALNRYELTELPVYAIKEFKRGPLKNFVWIYNKFATLGSYQAVITALQRMSLTPRRYTTSTALEALQTASVSLKSLKLQDLKQKYGSSGSLDSILCDHFRLQLRRKIERAWSRRRVVTSSVVNELSCYEETAPFEDKGLLVLNPTKCDPAEECCLAGDFKKRRNDINKLITAIPANSERKEDQRRRQALRGLAKFPKRPMTEKMCTDLGDAVFALQAPSDARILTTNERDHRPLAVALGKAVETPDTEL